MLKVLELSELFICLGGDLLRFSGLAGTKEIAGEYDEDIFQEKTLRNKLLDCTAKRNH